MADFDLSALMQQAQALQGRLKQMQDEAAAKTVEAQAGGGMVEGCGGRLDAAAEDRNRSRAARLERQADDPGPDRGRVNDGLRRAQDLVTGEMGKLAGPLAGLKLPGTGED